MTDGTRYRFIVDAEPGCENVAWFSMLRAVCDHPNSPTVGIVTPEGDAFLVRRTRRGWSITQTEKKGKRCENQDRN